MKKIKNIAIIAFDTKKTDLIEWSYFNREILIPHQIFASGFAGQILEGTLNKKVNIIDTISFNGYRELCNFVNNNQIDAIIIFGDADQIFETKELNTVLKAAAAQNLAVAVNRTTADFIIQSSLIAKEYLPHSSAQKNLGGQELLNTAGENFPLAKAS
jgi:methylglyoxal synthase